MSDYRQTVGRRRHFRFGLGTLLLIVAGLAAVCGGLRFGYESGYTAGKVRWFNEVYPVVYNDVDFSKVNDLTIRIEPQSWQEVGGPGMIVGVGRTQLLINQTADVHEQIRKFLQSLRDGRLTLEDEPATTK